MLTDSTAVLRVTPYKVRLRSQNPSSVLINPTDGLHSPKWKKLTGDVGLTLQTSVSVNLALVLFKGTASRNTQSNGMSMLSKQSDGSSVSKNFSHTAVCRVHCGHHHGLVRSRCAETCGDTGQKTHLSVHTHMFQRLAVSVHFIGDNIQRSFYVTSVGNVSGRQTTSNVVPEHQLADLRGEQ